MARHTVRVLSSLYAFGRLTIDGFPEINPAARQKMRTGKKGGRIWEPHELDAMVAAADQLGLHSIGTAITLNHWIGQREGDVLTMPRSAYRNGEIVLEQHKTGVWAPLPVDLIAHLTERLEAEFARQSERRIEALPERPILICELTGKAWNEFTFRHKMIEIRADAAKAVPSCAGLQFQHLRHTAVVRLAEAECTDEIVSAITGHSLVQIKSILEHYLTRTRKMARTAFQKRLEAEGETAPVPLTIGHNRPPEE